MTATLTKAADTEKAPTGRTNDPARTMANILAMARAEFAEKGLAGARIDEIAAATQTSKRMIYYYFQNKEGLYLAVLEAAYREMREQEADLHLDDLPPLEALRTLVSHTFDRQWQHEDYARLIMTENINRGQTLARSQFIQELNVPAISSIEQLYQRGVAEGTFRPGLDPVEIHASISALTFFNVSNQHTFGLIFKLDTAGEEWVSKRRKSVVEMVERFLLAD